MTSERQGADLRALHHRNPSPGARGGRPPAALSPQLALRHSLGNAALLRLMQARLSVSQPDDPFEQEAERVADAVTRTPAPTANPAPNPARDQAPAQVHRACPACAPELERQALPEEEMLQTRALAPADQIQRQAPLEEDEQPLAAKAAAGTLAREEIPEEEPLARRAAGIDADGAVSDEVETALAGLAGRGQPLPEPVRADLEPRFGADFSAVRVHTDAAAHDLARAVHAEAFTLGTDVVFGAGRYAPETGTGRHLLAHELTHVVQQGENGVQTRVQRSACPARAATEVADSRTPQGLLLQNVVFNAAQNELVIRDFGVDRADLPPGVSDSPDWQRAMSLIVGDPSVMIALGGYSDCAGTTQENLSLRGRRADQVRAALPAAAQAKVLTGLPVGTSLYLSPNDSASERASNRAVKVWIRPGVVGRAGQDPCDMLTQARNMDECLFLLRCAETRLAHHGHTAPIVVLSALRQLYYGNAAWSVNRISLFDTVIAVRPFPSSSDLPGMLGAGLYGALSRTDTVDGIAIGHLFAGMDAMAHLANITVGTRIQVETGLINQEVATWSGDVGSAAAEFLLDDIYGRLRFNRSLQGYFSQGYAKDDDLRADVEAYALRLGLQPGRAAPAVASQPLTLNQPVSSALLEFYRVTSSALGTERSDAKRRFLEAHGGVFAGGQLANRPQVFTALQESVGAFAVPFVFKGFGDRLRSQGPAPGVPDLDAFLPIAGRRLPPLIDQATNLFIDWLLR